MEPTPTYFYNGEYQNNTSMAETDICSKLNIILCDGLGQKKTIEIMVN